MSIPILSARFIVRNVTAAAVALLAYLLVVFVDVRTGQDTTVFRSSLFGGIAMVVTFIAFCFATWPGVEGSRVARSAVTVAASAVVFSVWLVVTLVLAYWFHFAVGGIE